LTELNGNGKSLSLGKITGGASALVGAVGMIGFLYSQFETLREHEEFRKTLAEIQVRNDDAFKHIDDRLTSMVKSVSELQGIIYAHQGGKK
jgi:hypothetical protein